MKAGFLLSVLKEMRAGFLLSSLLLSLFHSSFGLNEDGFNETKGARDVRVGVVLAMDSLVGRVSNSCIALAIEDFYNEHPNFDTRLTISWRDSGEDVIKAVSAGVDLMKHEKVQAIIGPQTSGEAEFLANLGDKSQVPVLSFSATSPSLSSSYTPYFVLGAVNDAAQAKPIAALLKAYGWRQAVAICEDSKFKSDLFLYLRDALEEIGSRLQYKSILPTFASEELIGQELYKLMTMQTRVFIVHMSSPLASRLFQKAQEIGMMSKDNAWIISDELAGSLSSMDPSAIASMQGVLAVKTYIPKSQRLANFITRWKHFYSAENTTKFKVPDLNVFGLRAYDMTWVLALAVQKSGTTALPFQQQSTEEEIGNFTDLSNLGISPSGPSILRAILGTTFKGLTGDIRFINGELKASTFQVINIVKEGIRVIGFWSPVSGLSPVAERTQENKKKGYTANMADLRPVTWPGETAVVPKGWVIPTNSKKLRIGVPIKRRYQEFVKVERDPATGRLQVTGFSIDVFAAVMEVLPYSLPYEFLPFADSEGNSAGSYNDMINQVVQGNYDAVVGDVTILVSRSNQVDFTPPYSSAGVSMIVPLQKEKRTKAWTFLKPLTWELWVITTCLFFFMAFVFWVLEHRINENFQGPPIEQLGTALYFSFSTLVFAQRDRINGNMTRFVLVLWLFAVLILTSSYTANLASILTVGQLQPTVVDIETLIKNGDYIGYQNNSYVEGLLVRSGFSKLKLMPYDTPDEYAETLSRGSSNGGVAAIFDEDPYIQLFVSSHSLEYTMVGPIFRTGGFGFVFPKNSLLLSDISNAVLNISEGGKIDSIERASFRKRSVLHNNTSTALSLDCFWGLFVIVWTTSIGALMIFSISFCHKRATGETTMASQSKWQRIKAMARRFDEKELLWHVFQRRESRNREMELDRDGRPIATDSASSFYMDGEVHFTDDNIRCCSASDSGDDSPAAVPTSTMEEGHTNAQGMCGPFP